MPFRAMFSAAFSMAVGTTNRAGHHTPLLAFVCQPLALTGSAGPVPTLPDFGPGSGNGAALKASSFFGFGGPDQKGHQGVTEILKTASQVVGPSIRARTGGTLRLVGQPDRRVSGPSDGSVSVRQGRRSKEERSTVRRPVDPVH